MAEFLHYELKKNPYNSPPLTSPLCAARLNLNEPRDRSRALTEMKDRIGASINFAFKDKSCLQHDDFLFKFLFAKKLNVDEAFQLLINYFNFRQKHPDLFNEMSIMTEAVQQSLKDGFPGVLPERDRRGRRVIVYFASNWNFQQYSLLSIFKATLLTLDKLMTDKQNQANGLVVIVDWTNFTFRQSSQLNPKVLKLMIEGLDECYPARFKAIHFVGQSWLVEVAMTLIKSTLKEKTRKRIHMHGTNLSTLHEMIARDILPTELGGDGAPLNNENWYNTLLESLRSGSTDSNMNIDNF